VFKTTRNTGHDPLLPRICVISISCHQLTRPLACHSEQAHPPKPTGASVTIDQPSAEDLAQASPRNIEKMRKFVRKFADKSGSFLHPQPEITEFLVIGLAKNIDELGKPLCPCMFFEDKQEELDKKFWICPCEEMQRWKYCH
jgi:ferredoxin-thioredoxin reductase catalytic subunit